MFSIKSTKTFLLKLLGDRTTAYIQAIRFLYLLRINPYPEPELHLLEKLLNRGDTAVDVGANGANWTNKLHQRVGPTGLVFAFEADPYYALATGITIDLLRLKGVHFFPFGLSNRDENALLRTADEGGQRHAGLGHIDRGANQGDAHTVSVKLATLDSLVIEHPALLETALIKCDVEGYELFVMQGAEEILRRARPYVILEIGNFEKHGYCANELHNFFSSRNYLCFAMCENGSLVRTNADMENVRSISVNRVLIPEERLSLLEQLIPDSELGDHAEAYP